MVDIHAGGFFRKSQQSRRMHFRRVALEAIMRFIFSGAIATLVLLLPYARAFSADDLPGSTVLARSDAHATIIWDATPLVASLVQQNASQSRELSALELPAARLIVERAASLRQAKDIAVKVIYARTGAVSPVYNNVAYAGFERILTLVSSRKAVMRNARAWNDSIRDGRVPSGIQVIITGQLPQKP